MLDRFFLTFAFWRLIWMSLLAHSFLSRYPSSVLRHFYTCVCYCTMSSESCSLSCAL
jgi:hypothetical protein